MKECQKCDYKDEITNENRIKIPKLLDEFEAANLLRKSVHWLRRMRSRGETNLIPFSRIGSSIRYDERDVIQFIEQAKQF